MVKRCTVFRVAGAEKLKRNSPGSAWCSQIQAPVPRCQKKSGSLTGVRN
jgi:hypothetical protein